MLLVRTGSITSITVRFSEGIPNFFRYVFSVGLTYPAIADLGANVAIRLLRVIVENVAGLLMPCL